MTDLDDDLVDEVPARAKYGLTADEKFYRFPPPPGITIPKGWRGWRRATNLVGAFSDQRALQLWLERMTLLGLLAHGGLVFDELAATGVQDEDDEGQRRILSQYAEMARSAVGADAGSRKGTARHFMLEGYLTTGRRNGHGRMMAQLDSLQDAMEANELDWVPGYSERRVWHSAAGGTMGTLDARVMCRRTGQVGILDLKTQARFWTYQEICGQQCLYDEAEWMWEGPQDDTGRWVTPPANDLLGHPDGLFPGRRVALLAHMPLPKLDEATGLLVDQPVEIHEVDLDYGAEVIRVAELITDLRSRGRSVAAGRRVGGVRPPSVCYS